jgi:hypothetical protein
MPVRRYAQVVRQCAKQLCHAFAHDRVGLGPPGAGHRGFLASLRLAVLCRSFSSSVTLASSSDFHAHENLTEWTMRPCLTGSMVTVTVP